MASKVESRLQISFVKWFRLQYPQKLIHHTHNEGFGFKGGYTKGGKSFGAIYGGQAKAMGQTKGWPDLMVYEPSGNYIGLAIEMKATFDRGRKGKLSVDQKEILSKLELRNWKTVVVYNLDEAIEAVNSYFNV